VKRTAFVLFATTTALAMGFAYALTLVYLPVEAAAIAFFVGAAWAFGVVPTWRTFRRLTR
jgi:nitrate/nitrite transporter NarK